jgi:hypothetical protein
MKAYVMVTGAAFGIVSLVHVWRFIVERSVGSNPFFLAITVTAAALAVWAGRLLWSAPRS